MVGSSWLELNIILGLSICFCSETQPAAFNFITWSYSGPFPASGGWRLLMLPFVVSLLKYLHHLPVPTESIHSSPCHFLLTHSPDYSVQVLCISGQYFPHSFLFLSLEIPGLPFSVFERGHFSASISLLRARQAHVSLLPDPWTVLSFTLLSHCIFYPIKC